MKKHIFMFYGILLATGAITQETHLVPKSQSENIKIEILCSSSEYSNKKLQFILKISNNSSHSIKISKSFILSPADDSEGNIGYELFLLGQANDTVNIHSTIQEDKVIRPELLYEKIIIDQSSSYLREVYLSNSYFPKKGKYMIRFNLRKNFWNPGDADLLSNWFKFEVR